jgi:NADH-quinone oxidoreductase subunit L
LEEISTYHSSFFVTCLILTLALPLVSFIVSFAISEKYSWLVSFSAPFLLLINTLAALVVFYWTWNNVPFTAEWTWISFGNHSFTAGVLINNTSALMLVVVTLVSFLVNFYSIGYMAGDPDIRRYFAMLGFFTFSMLGIVASSNLLLIFIFWELVGFSSYMLIGHWNQKPEAADAAKRAFILNRVGDAGFVVGLMVVWSHTGSFDILCLSSVTGSAGWQTVASLGIFCGIIGKSAQFPLFAWLPDAMEGPTPVSALIHAATMVAAGVFLLSRVHFLFTPVTLDVVAITGCITALLGALSALAQYDLKKILAYSTVSQLGLMITSLGAGAPEAAMLHLFTHAFFKACLFLAAGSVIHSLHQSQHQSHTTFDVQDIRNLGGLKKKLPYTFLMFVLSGASLAGIPFFSGFLSKDAILTSIFVWKGDVTWRWLILACAFLVSFITVLYTFRMIWSIFFGDERSTKNLSVVEPPPVMRAPMALLAAASLWIIVSANPFNFSGWVYNGLVSGKHFHLTLVVLFSAAWVLLALLAAYVIRNRSIDIAALRNGFYFNDIYRKMIETPAFKTANLTSLTDIKWIDGLLHVGAYVQLIVAHVTGWIDRAVVDGVVDDTAGMAKGIGSFIRSFQSGKIQLYVFWASFAIIIFIIWTLL